MMTNKAKFHCLHQRGFTTLELVVVIAAISVLVVVALHYYYKLLVDVERSTMELDLTTLRSAISLQVADHFAKGTLADLEKLIHSNPVDLLDKKPVRYLGVINYCELDDIEKGHWFFDDKESNLVYLVKHQLYFETTLAPPARARFKIEPVFTERLLRGRKKYVTGLILKKQEPYRWLEP